jgi:hypothetical protein
VDQNVKSEASAAGRAKTAGVERPHPPGTRKEDWIAQHLRRVYDDALNEGIPQEMLDLLNTLDESDPEKGNRG